MKRIQKNILMLAALLMTGAAMISCDNVDNAVMDQQTNNSRTYTMIVDATMGGSAQTRALEQDGQTKAIKATWTEGEDAVEVYGSIGNVYQKLGELTAQSSGKSTLLVGPLDEGKVPAVGDYVDLIYPKGDMDYSDQDGTFDDIAANHDFAMVKVKVTNVDNSERTITTERATLRNLQSIIKFTLIDNSNEAIVAASLNVSFTNNSNVNQLVTGYNHSTKEVTTGDILIARAITNADNANQIWAALTTKNLFLGNASNETVNVDLIASNDDVVYFFTKSGFTFSTSKFYDFTAKMKTLTEIETPANNVEAITAAVTTIATNYTKISLEQAWNLAQAQKAINGSDVLVLYNVDVATVTASYASSADATATVRQVTGLEELMTLFGSAGYYVQK